jgi:hypothetical protein
MDIKITLFVGFRLMRIRMPSTAELKHKPIEPLSVSEDWKRINKSMSELKTFFTVKDYAFYPKTKLAEEPEVYVGFAIASCETDCGNSTAVSISRINKYTKLFRKAFAEEPQILFGFTID